MIQVEEEDDEEEEEEEEEVCLKMSNQDDEIKQQQQQVKNEPASNENDAASQRQQQQSMDDLFEQILNMPAGFPDISQQSSDRLFSRSSMQGLSGLGSEALDSYQFSYLQSMQQRQSESSALANAPLGPVNASAVALLTASSQQPWRMPYSSPGVQPFSLAIGQAQQQQQLGKRLREDEPRPPPASNPVFLKNFGAAEGIRPNIPSSQTLPSIPFQSYDAHAGMAHQQQPPQSQAHHQQSLQPPSQASPITVGSGQQVAASSPAAPAPTRPRVRARRGQATDPHSIAERQRRERIAERMKALQELVPTCNKTDKGAMLDEIIDYVKFLQLQVKVLSMSRIGGAEAVAPLVAEMSSEVSNGMQMGRNASPTDESLAMTEQQVARLMEQDTGAAMQYLQSKGMCLMPLSLAATLTSANPAAAAAATVTATSRMHHSSSPHIIIRSPSSDTVENHREATGASTTVAAAAASAPASSSTEASSVKPGPGPGCRAPSAGAGAGAGAGPGPGPAQ